MSAILQESITAFGEPVSGIKIPIGSTVLFTIHCQDPDTRAAIDLAGANVVMSLCQLDLQGNPSQPPVISRQADISDPTSAGICTVPWASGDTVVSGVGRTPGSYGFDLWLTDVSGDRLSMLTFGTLELVAAAGLPDAVITPLPDQEPLALGPIGLNWRGLWDNSLTYALRDAVYYVDTNGETSSYRCILATTAGIEPTNATYWDPLALGGSATYELVKILTPDFAGERRVIYVRSTGDDSRSVANGGGTLSHPFLTPEHALDVSYSFLRNGRVVIDMSGYGTYAPTTGMVLPQTTQLQTKVYATYVSGFTNPDFGAFSDEGDITFQAVPTLSDTITSGWVNSHDAITGIVTITDSTKSWTPNALVGKFVAGANAQEIGYIVANDGTSVTLGASHVGFSSSTLGIYTTSCTIQPSAGATGISFFLTGQASVQFNGIKLLRGSSCYFNAVVAQHIPQVRFLASDIGGITFMEGVGIAPGGNHLTGCRISSDSGTNGVTGFEPCGSMFQFDNCYFKNVSIIRILSVGNGRYSIGNSYADGCHPLGHTLTENALGSPLIDPIAFLINGMNIVNSTGYGIQYYGGAPCQVGGVRISSAVSDAIHADGVGKLSLTYKISGTGNGGYGLRATNGVQIDVPVGQIDITGTSGNFICGLHSVRTWSNFESAIPQYNELDYSTLTRVYEASSNVVYGVEAVFSNSGRPSASAVAVGTRIWNSTSKSPNWSDGTNWYDAAGSIA